MATHKDNMISKVYRTSLRPHINGDISLSDTLSWAKWLAMIVRPHPIAKRPRMIWFHPISDWLLYTFWIRDGIVGNDCDESGSQRSWTWWINICPTNNGVCVSFFKNVSNFVNHSFLIWVRLGQEHFKRCEWVSMASLHNGHWSLMSLLYLLSLLHVGSQLNMNFRTPLWSDFTNDWIADTWICHQIRSGVPSFHWNFLIIYCRSSGDRDALRIMNFIAQVITCRWR